MGGLCSYFFCKWHFSVHFFIFYFIILVSVKRGRLPGVRKERIGRETAVRTNPGNKRKENRENRKRNAPTTKRLDIPENEPFPSKVLVSARAVHVIETESRLNKQPKQPQHSTILRKITFQLFSSTTQCSFVMVNRLM